VPARRTSRAAARLPADPIATARLVLRGFEARDRGPAAEMHGDPEARRLAGGAVSRAQSDRWVAEQRARVRRTGLGARAVVEGGSGAFLGYCGLQTFAAGDEIELFYGYGRHAWGRGIAGEAARALLALGFRCLRPSRIVALVDRENRASLRVLEKLGFLGIGTWRHARDGRPCVLLALERRAWQAARRRGGSE
jgi:ribosomal-protein-alanine N-acetyltransferase